LVLAAGVAQAEVTFSGKAEAGVSRTEKTAAGAQVLGFTSTVSGLVATATTNAATANAVLILKAELADLEADLVAGIAALADDTAADARDTQANANAAIQQSIVAKKAQIAIAEPTAAVTAVAAGDMKAYSGYDMDVSVSSTLDNGMELSAAFDMGAGSIADRDDDRELDAQAAAVALSTVTIKNGGVTYVIGNDEIDDLYDDSQNGDVSVSGAFGGISYTLVADLDKDVKAAAATYTAAPTPIDRTANDATIVMADATAYAHGVDSATPKIGDSDYVGASFTDAVAAVHESTSLSLSGAAGGVDWTFTTTNKNDRGNAATKVSLGYAAGDALSFTLTHDTQGKREAINTLKASYTMDAITLTASMADDKNHAGNTNKSGKASQNLTIAYANGPLTASFNNDESSAWWATTSYDLGNGADLFATVDHQEFAVVGLTFAF
jgi:hypothetical protein